MRDDKNFASDLDDTGDDQNLNPERLSELGVRTTSEGYSVKRERKGPRRTGRGAKQAPKQAITNPPTQAAVPAPTEVDTFSADEFGGEKSLVGRRVINFMKVAKPFAVFSAILTLVAIFAIK